MNKKEKAAADVLLERLKTADQNDVAQLSEAYESLTRGFQNRVEGEYSQTLTANKQFRSKEKGR